MSAARIITDLKESIFFRFDKKGKLEPCRRSISALFLVAIDDVSCWIVGILHPQPKYSFDTHFFPNIPFLKVSNWPCQNGQILKEWNINDSSLENQDKIRSKRIWFEDLIKLYVVCL